MDLQINN